MPAPTIEDLPTEIKLRILQMVTWTSKHSPKSLVALASTNREFSSIYIAHKRFLQIESMGTYLPEAFLCASWREVLEAADFAAVETDDVWQEMAKTIPEDGATVKTSRLTRDQVEESAILHRKICALLWDAPVGPDSFCFYGRLENCWQTVRRKPEKEEHLLSCIYGFYASSESAMDRLCKIKHRSEADIDYFWHSFFSCYMIWIEPEIMKKITNCHDALAEVQGIEIDPTDERFESAVNFLASVILRYGPSIVYDLVCGNRKQLVAAIRWVGTFKTRFADVDANTLSPEVHERIQQICEVLAGIEEDDLPDDALRSQRQLLLEQAQSPKVERVESPDVESARSSQGESEESERPNVERAGSLNVECAQSSEAETSESSSPNVERAASPQVESLESGESSSGETESSET